MEKSKALKIAKEYMKINKQLVLDLVGSLARGDKEIVNDIDFITTLELPNGKKYYKTEFRGMQIDIWRVKNRTVGKMMRTLSKGELIHFHQTLKNHGYKLTEDGIKDIKTGKLVPFTLKGGKIVPATILQAILFDRNKWTIEDAKEWFSNHQFQLPFGKEIHLTGQFIRFRLHHPEYSKFTHRTKWLSKSEGIKAIVAIPKK